MKKKPKVHEVWGVVYIAKEGVNPDKWPRGKVPGIDRGRDENPEVYEVDLDGIPPPAFPARQIVSYGEEDLDEEAGIYVIYEDGSEETIQDIQKAREFFARLYNQA